MTTAKTAQIPSLRILPAQRKLIEEAAKAAGQSVTDWARDQLLKLATDFKMDEPKGDVQKLPEPKRYKSGTQLKAVVPPKQETPKRKGLELDEEHALLLAGYPPGYRVSS